MYLLIHGKPMMEENKGIVNKDIDPKPLEFTKIVKTKTDIKCYQGSKLYCTLGGVQNWDTFTVEGGEFTIEILKEEFLTKTITELKIDNLKKDKMIKELGQQISNINLQILKRGAK